MAPLLAGTVKLVLSGDTLVLRGSGAAERTLSLAFVAAPRLGSAKAETADEAFGLEAREYLRRRLVGRAVRFRVAYTAASGREFGVVVAGPDAARDNVAVMAVREGWARHRPARDGGASDEDAALGEALADAEQAARQGRRGMWDAALAKTLRPRATAFDGDGAALVAAHAGRDVRATVEAVRDATTLRVLLHLPAAHQLVTVQLAGVRGAGSDAVAAEARAGVEARLLQRDVRVRLLAAAPARGVFVAAVAHDAGSIAEWLVGGGFARVLDGAPGADAARLRALEADARAARLRLWADAAAVPPPAPGFDATVERVVSGDTLVAGGRELRLASVRAPPAQGPLGAGYADQARDALRRLCIGACVAVTPAYTQPPAAGFAARECVSVRVRGEDAAVRLVRAGLLTVVRHRADDARAANFHDLAAAEAAAVAARAGVHSGVAAPRARPADASESPARARSMLPHWLRAGRVPCVVEHVAAGARLRVAVRKDAAVLTLVLAAVRCPRAPEPLAADALAHSVRVALQRDAEVEIEAVDATGAFIGCLWLPRAVSLAEDLLRNGLAELHAASADRSPRAAALHAAENLARDARLGLWANAAPQPKEPPAAAPVPVPPAAQALAPRSEFLDVVVSELSAASPTRFFVQIVRPGSAAGLEALMAGLAIDKTLHQPEGEHPPFVPKVSQLVAARDSAAAQWLRARVTRVSAPKRECDVVYVDYGNAETLSLDCVRPLPASFAALEPQAHEAQLAFLRLPDQSFIPDYAPDALAEFRRLVEDRQLVANVEARSAASGGLLHLTLYDPELGKPLLDQSVNGLLASAGFAVCDKKALSSMHNAPAAAKIAALVDVARSAHCGMWEYGDVTAEE
ncbi:hypothetical protein H4R26_004497 [Coemansia thaxteri]|uniref:Uncharacterized protein n=1 Tax=Coemansia thaxteri TaxID=2663907 RepID=A0A9W8EDK3_9FUNG|nr:hypothetical protein H4R26_004497 [Coemansia thaxteri]KAJ2486894.1 hypothetical protein EV174_000842 [Coemansia sp. RSA 2320]